MNTIAELRREYEQLRKQPMFADEWAVKLDEIAKQYKALVIAGEERDRKLELDIAFDVATEGWRAKI